MPPTILRVSMVLRIPKKGRRSKKEVPGILRDPNRRVAYCPGALEKVSRSGAPDRERFES